MKRNMLFGAGAAALACLLGGCQLAVPQGAAGQDTLIGGYATWESIPYFFLSGKGRGGGGGRVRGVAGHLKKKKKSEEMGRDEREEKN